jgi:TPR repeat protein
MIKITASFKRLAVLLCIGGSATLYADVFKDGGEAYQQGNFAAAAERFKEVAAKGDHRAMYALGSMYAGGTGVKQDYREAFKWFSEAAKYGRLDAQYKLGLMYELGVGVKQNYRQAARYYQRVGQKGYAHGQFKFGQLYLRGDGVKQDLVRAYAWMAVARQNFLNSMPRDTSAGSNPDTPIAVDHYQTGDVFAVIHLGMINAELDGIKGQLTAAQLQEAQTLAQEFIQYR